MIKLPNEFTGCEEYRGHAIAVRHGFYEIFNAEGGIYLESHYTSRERARRGIDQLDHTSRFTSSLTD